MNDKLVKGHFKGLDIAFSFSNATSAVNTAVLKHNCDPVAAHLLGRAVTGALLSAAILPEKHRLNACWKYTGDLKTIVVDAGQDGTVRGFISPAQLNLTEDGQDALYGDMGNVQVVCSNDGTVTNSGTAPVSLHDVAKDLAFFHCVSDQVETGLAVMIGFNPDPENPVKLCQGWMIQALPGCNLERFERIRQRMDSDSFRERLAEHAHPEELASLLCEHEEEFEELSLGDLSTPVFECPCTKEKMNPILRTLPIPDRMELVKKNEDVGVRCQFCNELYSLTIEECITAWNEKLNN